MQRGGEERCTERESERARERERVLNEEDGLCERVCVYWLKELQ